jgi:protein gp37
MAMWNPWRGCHRISEGCRYCYTHKGDVKRGVDTNEIIKLNTFDAPVATDKKGNFKMKSGQMVYVCFSSDFLLEEADPWRSECWEMMKLRPDLRFLFLTKRIDRFLECIPDDWGEGYENVTVGCSVENQSMAQQRLSVFSTLPVKHKNIILQPLIEAIDIEQYLHGIELVVVGGEYDINARPLDYSWVLAVREQCVRQSVSFDFRQCGSSFIVDGEMQKLSYAMLCRRAREMNISFRSE